MLRRTFLKSLGAASLYMPFSNSLSKVDARITWSSGLKPLYCLAYIDPEYPPHKGQELSISRYPLAIIPQDSRSRYSCFRNRLRVLNPHQKVLAYQMTLDENGLRGPGHELVRKVKNSWLTLPGGVVPTINIRSGNILKRRIYDPRDPEFRQSFVEACQILINRYEFDGIFLDNCTIYGRFASIPILGESLMQGLQQLIQEVRAVIPNAILVGNSRYNWRALNGEMNENRPEELSEEATSFSGHVPPVINMYYYKMNDRDNLLSAELNFRLALKNRCFFGTGVNAQTIEWYPIFDKVLSEYEVV